jgi:hypothetical protein
MHEEIASHERPNWESVIATIAGQLGEQDDVRLWEAALNTILSDAKIVLQRCSDRQAVMLQVGCCSHWIAPNKLRWLTDNGQFAGPAGYLSKRGWFGGLPEFDWSVSFETTPANHVWVPLELRGKRRWPSIRVAIPARTASRIRASVHVFWERGPRPDFTIARAYYGFRRSKSGWQSRAYAGPKIRKQDVPTKPPEPSVVPANEN